MQVPSLVQLQLEDRQAVLEGLVRIVTYLGPQEALDCAISLQQPLLARTQAILTNGSSTAAQGGPAAKQLLQHLAQELQLMAVLIKGMEMPGPPAAVAVQPAMKLLEAAWPALTAVAEAPVCHRDADVVQALCEVYKVSSGHLFCAGCGVSKGLLFGACCAGPAVDILASLISLHQEGGANQFQSSEHIMVGHQRASTPAVE